MGIENLALYTQTELNNAVDKARMEIIEAVKAGINECRPSHTGLLIGIDQINGKIQEIEEGFIGKSNNPASD